MKMMIQLVGFFLSAICMATAQAPTGPVSSYPTEFEVASVRMLKIPDGDGRAKFSDPGALLFSIRNVPLSFLVQYAFGLPDSQIKGEPEWMGSTLYAVSAKPDAETGPTYKQLKPMLQHLLAQRFHLQTHMEAKEVKGYKLVLAKGGARLTPIKGGVPTGGGYIYLNGLRAPVADMDSVAALLTRQLKQPVQDETGIQGKFDVKLDFAPVGVPDSNASLPSIFTAVQEQLGLKLEPAKVPVQILVIDHVDKVPTEN